MRRLPLALLGAGIVALLVGAAVIVFTVTDYLAHPQAINSAAGLPVFTAADGSLVSYEFFRPGIGPGIVSAGSALVVASLFLLAILWRGRPTRS